MPNYMSLTYSLPLPSQVKYQACDRHEDLLIDTTVVKTSLTRDYDFLCNQEVLNKGLLGAMYMVGMLIGSFVLGIVSDHIGRSGKEREKGKTIR